MRLSLGDSDSLGRLPSCSIAKSPSDFFQSSLNNLCVAECRLRSSARDAVATWAVTSRPCVPVEVATLAVLGCAPMSANVARTIDTR